MKKIILLFSAFIISAIIFTSCSTTGVTLTKRHYRNGYNLEVSSAQTKPAERAQNVIQPETVNKPVETEPEYASTAETSEKSYIKHKPFSFDQKEEGTAAVQESKSVDEKKGRKNFTNTIKQVSGFTKVANVKRAINKTFSHNADERNLGGLIWTLAGILLVLWLISLLTGGWGLGNFLHIFLVLALILILLRLIHVI